jgi:arsenate reductase
MYKVLIICTHNSARSQMAEAYLQQMGGENFQVESAGFEPGPINPDVIKVLLEDGIDISSKSSQKVFDLFQSER